MAHLDINSHILSGPLHGLGRMMSTLKLRVGRYRNYLRTRAELEALSARELADLGLSRSMIRRAAYKAAYE